LDFDQIQSLTLQIHNITQYCLGFYELVLVSRDEINLFGCHDGDGDDGGEGEGECSCMTVQYSYCRYPASVPRNIYGGAVIGQSLANKYNNNKSRVA
jgi:hypothetical protein